MLTRRPYQGKINTTKDDPKKEQVWNFLIVGRAIENSKSRLFLNLEKQGPNA